MSFPIYVSTNFWNNNQKSFMRRCPLWPSHFCLFDTQNLLWRLKCLQDPGFKRMKIVTAQLQPKTKLVWPHNALWEEVPAEERGSSMQRGVSGVRGDLIFCVLCCVSRMYLWKFQKMFVKLWMRNLAKLFKKKFVMMLLAIHWWSM